MYLTQSMVAITLSTALAAQVPNVTTISDAGAPAHPDVQRLEAGQERAELDTSQFRPMPLPVVPPDQNTTPPGAGKALRFDIATRTVVAAPPGDADLLQKVADLVRGSRGEVTGQSEFDLMRENYNALQLVSSYKSFPWRMNVKIFMTFPDNSSWVGSGVLIDPKHVMTAAHVIFSKARGGWAKSVIVIPAYNGQRSAPGSEPYGRSTSTGLLAWTGWTSSGSYYHDIAVIRLGRPVGAITGWFGYGYRSSTTFFTQTGAWSHVSYPSEAVYSGKRMYYQWGNFDSCPNAYEARINRISYTGESGSGHYRVVGSNRYIYAITSHRHSGVSDAVRLTSAKYTSVSSYLMAARPTSFDLTPLDLKAVNVVARGTNFAYMNVLLHNYSRNTVKGTFRFSVYLSTNNYITTYDRKLGDFAALGTIGPLGSLRVVFASGKGPLVPASMPVGDYYVGAILTTRDSNSSNQHTLADDTVKVRVYQKNSRLPFGKSCRAGMTHTISYFPKIGTMALYRLSGAPRSRAATLVIGVSRRWWNGAKLPLHLGFLGMPGCYAYVDHRLLIGTKTSVSGNATVGIRLPNDKNLLGQRYYTQYIAETPGANAIGVTTSNAMECLIGN